MPKGVSKESFLTIAKTWYHMMQKSYEDTRANLMMGLIEKNIPDFLKWMSDHADFEKVKDVTLHEFVETMKQVGLLREAALKQLIDGLESNENSS